MPSCRFIKSAVLPKDFPPDEGIEIAIVGRSNAGKSSLINLITGTRAAKVSSTPGKTRLLNFFDMNKKYVLVDMPGYGFAARSHAEKDEWKVMIEAYFALRQSLGGLVLVMDSRREWSQDEEDLKKFTQNRGLPLGIAFTKIDKLTKNELAKAVAKVRKDSAMENIFPMSTLKKVGHVEMENWVYQACVRPRLEGQA